MWLPKHSSLIFCPSPPLSSPHCSWPCTDLAPEHPKCNHLSVLLWTCYIYVLSLENSSSLSDCPNTAPHSHSYTTFSLKTSWSSPSRPTQCPICVQEHLRDAFGHCETCKLADIWVEGKAGVIPRGVGPCSSHRLLDCGLVVWHL